LTIYQRALRERFDSLHPTLRRFLGAAGGGRASGRLQVTRFGGRLRNLAATLLGIPPAGAYPMRLDVLPHGERQRWVRCFDCHVLKTRQSECRGLLVEASGPASLGFELTVQEGALLFRPRRAWVFGLRVPLWLAPHIEADNWPNEAGGWRVRVHFSVPLLGPVAEYAGDVTVEEPAGGEAPETGEPA
jgi:hypothetical protein